MRWILSSLVVTTTFVAIGCEDDSRQRSTGVGDVGEQDTGADGAADTTVDVGEDIPESGCQGYQDCVMSCATDYFMGAECIDGRWQCTEPGWFPVDDCPPGSCFGLPLPGEVCTNGWQCDDDNPGFWQSCYQEACLGICADWSEPREQLGCTCQCDPVSQVVGCEQTCLDDVEISSTLPGVTIVFDNLACGYTLEQLALGVTLHWRLVIEQAHEDVVSNNLQAQNCGPDPPQDIGLVTFATIEGQPGDGIRYCAWCDQGLCDPGRTWPALTLIPGEHVQSLEWTGRQWLGESDTGMPLGDPFPPGSYTLLVRSTGTWPDPSTGQDAPFSIEARFPIIIEE